MVRRRCRFRGGRARRGSVELGKEHRSKAPQRYLCNAAALSIDGIIDHYLLTRVRSPPPAGSCRQLRVTINSSDRLAAGAAAGRAGPEQGRFGFRLRLAFAVTNVNAVHAPRVTSASQPGPERLSELCPKPKPPSLVGLLEVSAKPKQNVTNQSVDECKITHYSSMGYRYKYSHINTAKSDLEFREESFQPLSHAN